MINKEKFYTELRSGVYGQDAKYMPIKIDEWDRNSFPKVSGFGASIDACLHDGHVDAETKIFYWEKYFKWLGTNPHTNL